MRSSHSIAIWLFECLDLDVALTGDLLEERERGRSAIWYWRQVLAAVWIAIWGIVRHHKLLALRATITGLAIEALLTLLWNRWGPDLPLFSLVQWIVQFSVVVLTQMGTGWVVARTHRAHPIPMVFAFLFFFLLWYVGANLSWIRMAFVDSIDQTRFRPYLAMFLMTAFTTILGNLLGAILAARPVKAK